MNLLTQKTSANYGGQALIEGVLIRGINAISVAVRRPNGSIFVTTETIGWKWAQRLRTIPLIRGTIVLAEMLTLGTKALMLSAQVSIDEGDTTEDTTLSSIAIGATLFTSTILSIGLFFILPTVATNFLDSNYATTNITSNIIEGMIRLGLFITYLIVIGLSKDVRRIFEYHGAEHMTVHAYENGRELTIKNIRDYDTPHPRCGTAFLLVVLIIAIIVHVLWTPPILWERILSRVILIPIITGISYEIIKWSSKYSSYTMMKLIIAPNLWLQSLTTKQPDDSQIEVAIHAMNGAIEADQIN
jgi:uncharacterized protein YqhQ